jgi:asparagine synthase (glutamine-hydrolysing)
LRSPKGRPNQTAILPHGYPDRMCGIVGFIDSALTAADEAASVLVRMRRAIQHRGPDDDGQIAANGIGLGVQRLSIVDLVTGHQPMTSADGKVWLVFNGEIYNHAELRARLEATGRQFRTRSDTEVILAQYEHFGLDGMRDLNGMFAFAIWDGRNRELHLVRDRLGIKPLYYYKDESRFYFGSEIKALLASGRFVCEPDLQSIWDFLTFRYVPAPRTIWQGIRKLPPAHLLTLSPDRLDRAPRRYWDIPYAKSHPLAADPSQTATFAALMQDAVHIRMLADVPVGVFLSGGLDSSLVAASVNREDFPDLKTFSVALEDAGEDDERDYAKLVANYLRTDHHEVVVSAQQFIDFLPELPVHTDEPLADPTCVPVYFLSKLAREQVKVVLSGEGADEVFAGYTFDQVQKSWDDMMRASKPPTQAPSRFGAALNLLMGRQNNEIAIPPEIDQRRVAVPLHITNYLSSTEKQKMFIGDVALADSIDVLKRDLARVLDPQPLNQSLYLYCQNWLVEDLLMKADKMTMAASLELRTPFLDYRIVEWAARTPVSNKVRRLPNGQYATKAILRDYARSLLPPAIIERPKKGFPVPIFDWFSNRLRPFVHDVLGDDTKCGSWLERSAIKAFVASGTAQGAKPFDRHRLWHLLVLELWARAWLQ